MNKLYAVFVGILVSIMVTFNGLLAKYAGDYLSLIIIHLVGLVILLPIMFFKKEKLSNLKGIPIYLFSAGALGVFMVFSNNMTFNFLGVSLTISLVLLGQSIASCIIDHYGLFEMEVKRFQKEKLLGFLLVLIGIVTMFVY
ncbi:DMT family transporter [Wukongibacter baidiensis]|uniref:DMT family transporter n=1 Tax=Wukongibacter baidiensis TaxID=1723361 RepID=UPI003D7FA33F